ncbi:MAG TPA: GGDEF domain-containing protein [Acidobacteria bacterium]|nr:GGDEF domain-containing protein [Acidobacteriota bacterium]
MRTASWLSLGAPPLAAIAAAVAAPWLTGAAANTALAAAAAVCLAAAAHALGRPAGSPRALRVLAGGLAALAVVGAAGVLLAAPTQLLISFALLGAACCSVGATLVSQAWQRREAEIVRLRSQLVRREGDVRAQADRIRRLDLIDPVTGVLNRRGLLRAIEVATAESASRREPLALFVVELPDDLPRPGEPTDGEHGRCLGRAVGSAVRGSDALGRWSDRHLALVLSCCHNPRPAAERLQQALEALGLPRRSAPVAGVTIGPEGPWPAAPDLMAAAEAALDASRRAPDNAEAALWPVQLGLSASVGASPDH